MLDELGHGFRLRHIDSVTAVDLDHGGSGTFGHEALRGRRQEDIPLLVQYFVKRFAEKMKKRIRRVDERALERCKVYPWPGNIRELQNIVERAVILCAGDTLAIDEAWLSERGAESEVLPEALRDQEKTLIEMALARCQGKVAGADGAAAQLGIPASTLESKIRQLKIEKRRYARSFR